MKAKLLRYSCGVIILLACLLISGCSSLGMKKASESGAFSDHNYYDSDTGQVKTGEALKEELEEQKTEYIDPSQKENIIPSNDVLWDQKGTPAFYIPDYHSSRPEDVIEFIILDVVNDGKTIVYAYETVYYGTEEDWNGMALSGTVPNRNRHRDWLGDIKDVPPQKERVCCMMMYNIESREYKILYHAKEIIDDHSRVEIAESSLNEYNESDSQKIKETTSDDTGSSYDYIKNLFASKVKDIKNLFGDEYYYYLFNGKEYCVFDLNGNLRIQQNLEADIRNAFTELLLTEEERQLNWTFKITEAVGDGGGNFYLKILAEDPNVVKISEEMSEEDAEQQSKRFILSFSFFKADEAVFYSENKNFDIQVEEWKSSELSKAEVLERNPYEFSTFQIPMTDYLNWHLGYSEIPNNKYLESTGMYTSLGKYWYRYNDGYMRADADALWEAIKEENEKKLLELEEKENKDGIYGNEIELLKEELDYMNNTAAPMPFNADNIIQVKNMYDQNENKPVFYMISSVAFDPTGHKSIYRMFKNPDEIEFGTNTELVERTISSSDDDSDSGSDEGAEDDSVEDVETEAEFIRSFELRFDKSGSILSFYFCAETDVNICTNYGLGYCQYYTTETENGEKLGELTFFNAESDVASLSLDHELVEVKLLPEDSSGYAFNAIIVGKDHLLMGRAKASINDIMWNYIPYYMLIADEPANSKSTAIQIVDYTNSAKEKTVSYKKHMILDNNAVCADGDRYRFSSLESGILLFDPRYYLTYVIDSGAYFSSWKLPDESYLAIGFQGDLPVNPLEKDIMKAKAYRIIPDEDKVILSTLQYMLGDDENLRALFIKDPAQIYEKYDLDQNEVLDKYAKTMQGIEARYQQSYDDFLTLLSKALKIRKSELTEKQPDLEQRYLYCTNQPAIEQLLIDVYKKWNPHYIDRDTIAVGEPEWYREIMIAQAYNYADTIALDAIKEAGGYIEEPPMKMKDQEESKEKRPDWNADIRKMYETVIEKKYMWSKDYSEYLNEDAENE